MIGPGGEGVKAWTLSELRHSYNHSRHCSYSSVAFFGFDLALRTQNNRVMDGELAMCPAARLRDSLASWILFS